MCNLKVKFGIVGFLVSCLGTLVGCSAFDRKKTEILTPIPSKLGEIVELKLKAHLGKPEIGRFYSLSHVETYGEGQILREKDEAVEFSIQGTTLSTSPGGDRIVQELKVLSKDGKVDLHTLGFPEEDETLELHLSPSARVLKAGSYSSDSIFFVPPVSLPETLVEVGDTWVLSKDWISRGNKIPLRLELVSILKGLYHCGEGDSCAEIEISGRVLMRGVSSQGLRFESEIRGRVLFATKYGTVVWSLIKNQERIYTKDSLLKVSGCMTSELNQPQIWQTFGDGPINCKADFVVNGIPGQKVAE